MSDRISIMRHGWEVLASRSGPEHALRVLSVSEGPRPVRVAFTPDEHRGLLVGLADDELVRLPRSLRRGVVGALRAEDTYFEVPPAGQMRFLHVWCTDRRADQAFEAFCALLWESVEVGGVTEALQECCEEFRRLLQEDVSQPIPPTALGLIGELLVLAKLVELDPSLISAWTGPLGARHDFRRGDVAIETKTTLRSEARGRAVRIADIDQLEPPEGGRLYLYLVRVEQAMDGALSIRSLADRVAGLLGASEAMAFRKTLEEYLGHSSAEGRFQLNEEVAYRVDDGFPRLTRPRLALGRLDPGVEHVTYVLRLEGATAFEVSVDDVIGDCGELQA